MNCCWKNSEVWMEILTRCGVGSNVARVWAPVFSEEITDATFSAGVMTELPDFLGQILHESVMLTRLEENLYYTRPERLMDVWPKRFTTRTLANQYVRSPQRLANFVYGGRLGNDMVNDGWTYRGSGLIMCTGEANFQLVQDITGLPVVANPDMLRQPASALVVALAWWEARVPDSAMGDRVRVRRAVNGGEIGLRDTVQLSNLAQEVINAVA